MTNRVIGRKTNTKKVRLIAFTELLGFEGAPRQCQQHIVAERRIVERPIICRLRLETVAQGVREGSSEQRSALAGGIIGTAVFLVVQARAEARPLLAHPGIDDSGAIELRHPGMQSIAV